MKSLKDYILCEQQKEIANKVFEAKYSNFTNAELDAFKDELEYLKTNHEFLNKIINGRTVLFEHAVVYQVGGTWLWKVLSS